MNSMLRKLLGFLPARVADRLHSLKHRIYWLTKGGQSHQAYFDNYQTRSEIIGALRDWLSANPRSSPRVLEFGCSGGNNLRLMREIILAPIQYVGLDIQPDAIAFAKQKFPDDLFIVGDDNVLLDRAPGLGRFDVFLASSVLCYIPEERCQAVLSLAARIADLVLICDDLSRFDHSSGINDGLFLHPYARLCQEAGLDIFCKPPHLGSDRYSIFLACPPGRAGTA